MTISGRIKVGFMDRIYRQRFCKIRGVFMDRIQSFCRIMGVVLWIGFRVIVG